MSIAAVILAAGKGTRMKSRLPKVLHPLGGEPLITHVVRLAVSRKYSPIVVVTSRDGQRVRDVLSATFPTAPLIFAVQEQQRGTADAVAAAMPALGKAKGLVAILSGDVPLLRRETLAKLERMAKGAQVAVLTAELDAPAAYGRVVRENGVVRRIVEYKDASKAERAVREVNAGVYVCQKKLLEQTLGALDANNAQGELYLPDIVAVAAQKAQAKALVLQDPTEMAGVNHRADLAAAERELCRRLIERWQLAGVTFVQPDTVYLEPTVVLARDVHIGVGVQLYGATKVEEGARVLGPTVLRHAHVGREATVEAFSHLEQAKVGPGCHVGPFARLRPDAVLEEGARVGNFVEVKKARLGKGAKVNHLSYIGDATVGAQSNVGAGTITCNYDGGKLKHKTVLGKNVFVGSNTTLVAPVALKDGVFVAAGSVITKDVGKDGLAFGRAQQTNRDGYAKILRQRIASRAKES